MQPGRAMTAGSRGGGGASGRSVSTSCCVVASGFSAFCLVSAPCSDASLACSVGSVSCDKSQEL